MFLRRRVTPACVALFLFSVTAFSVTAAAQTVDEVVAKNLEAKGGEQRLRETTSARLSGTISMQGMKGSTVSLARRDPRSFRREMDIGGQKMVQGYDGTVLWMQRSGMPAQKMPTGPDAESFINNTSEFDAAFLDWQQKGHKIEYKGVATENGKEFHRLLFTPKNGRAIEYYIDATTWLEAKVVIEAPDGKGKAETRFTDYRNTDGRMIPFVTTSYVNGNQVMQVRLDRVEFNVPLDDALFRMPK